MRASSSQWAVARSPKSSPSASRRPFPPLFLPLLAIFGFILISLVPWIRSESSLAASFWSWAFVLLVSLFLLKRQVSQSGRKLSFTFVPRKVHYVQLTMHTCVYAYWGWYWREVYHHVPLILAQIVFAYACDMILNWSRKNDYVLGFGPFPIVLSTNLFLWFRDDWFYLQFLMIALGVFGKEFIRWKREGGSAHIFNPSALPLFVFSIVLLVTHSTPITWGAQIAVSLHYPPHIYLEIFLLGLVVQGLFSVTLVTLSAAATLVGLNLIYTGATGGLYHFVDSNIPVSVFLGLHLLVTDPATSPRSSAGKVIFGSLYGISTFGLYGLLGWLGAPQFYDKLLSVPVLNLMVRGLDRLGARIESRMAGIAARVAGLREFWALDARRANFAHMAIWSSLFLVMLLTNFVGHTHPGGFVEFWRRACAEGKTRACATWTRELRVTCSNGSGESCATLGQTLYAGRVVKQDKLEAARSLGRACDLGIETGCAQLADLVRVEGQPMLQRACESGDGPSCFILGSLLHNGRGLKADDSRAVYLFQVACRDGFARGCGRLGESYLWGEGVNQDVGKAMDSFEKACRGNYGPSCINAALMYHRGVTGTINEELATARLRRACQLGMQNACQIEAMKLNGSGNPGS